MARKVVIIGDGSVSKDLQSYLVGQSQLDLVGVFGRQCGADGQSGDLTELCAQGDLFVEAAGVAAVAEFGPALIAAGRDLLVASVGAFADPALRQAVLYSGPGRAYPTSGAIGGLDLISAAAASGGIDSVHLATRKKPVALVQDWMPTAQRTSLLALREAELLFSGSPAEAIAKFPASLNVAVALGLASGSMDTVSIDLIADPVVELTEHRIRAVGAAGEYDFQIRNLPNPEQPSSSGLTARALYSGLLRLAEPGGKFV